jgi:hypothetical protein
MSSYGTQLQLVFQLGGGYLQEASYQFRLHHGSPPYGTTVNHGGDNAKGPFWMFTAGSFE